MTTFQIREPGSQKISFFGATPVHVAELGIQFGGLFVVGSLMKFWGWALPWESWWVGGAA